MSFCARRRHSTKPSDLALINHVGYHGLLGSWRASVASRPPLLNIIPESCLKTPSLGGHVGHVGLLRRFSQGNAVTPYYPRGMYALALATPTFSQPNWATEAPVARNQEGRRGSAANDSNPSSRRRVECFSESSVPACPPRDVLCGHATTCTGFRIFSWRAVRGNTRSSTYTAATSGTGVVNGISSSLSM